MGWLGGGFAMVGLGWMIGEPEVEGQPNQVVDLPSPLVDQEANIKVRLPLLHQRILTHFGDPADQSLEERLQAIEKVADPNLQAVGALIMGDLLARSDVDTMVSKLIEKVLMEEALSGEAADALVELMEMLGHDDPERAWDLLVGLPEEVFESARGLGTVAIRERLKRDPESVFLFVSSLPSHSDERERLWALIAEELAISDLELAKQALARMPSSSFGAIAAVARAWAREDPVAAARWANRFEAFEYGAVPVPIEAVLSEWVQSDPIAALKAAEEYNPPRASGSRSMREDLIRQWGFVDPDAAIHWCLDEGGSYLGEAVVGSDPKRVLEIAKSHSADAEFRVAPAIAGRWIKSAPREALDWLARLPETEGANLARMKALNALGNTRDSELKAFGFDHLDDLWRPEVDVTTLGRGYHYGQRGLARGVISVLAQDSAKLWELIGEAVPVDHHALGLIVGEAARFDAVSAAQYVREHIDEVYPGVLYDLVISWSAKDPERAAEFVVQHRNQISGEWMSRIVSNFTQRWQDPEAMAAFREKLEELDSQ